MNELLAHMGQAWSSQNTSTGNPSLDKQNNGASLFLKVKNNDTGPYASSRQSHVSGFIFDLLLNHPF